MAKALPIAVLTLFSAMARAETDPTPELNAERDKLIEKIRDGVDYEASVKRFGELLGKRDVAVATTEAARAQERERSAAERADRDARHQRKVEYEKSVDWEVAWRCTLASDPANPPPSNEGRFRGDWGKVTRKESIRLPPKNAFDDGEPWTLYEVTGKKGRYALVGERSGASREHPFTAELGDLVLVCHGGESMDGRMPKSWGMRVMNSGFALRLARPPLIAQKARWNPIHVTGSALFWAVREVKWKYPPGAFILFNMEISSDLGGGRFRVGLDHRDLYWILEVPPSVKRPVALVPGQHVWGILGNPRFDKTERTLILTAEDLAERYIDEK